MVAGWIKIDRGITEMQGYFGDKFNRPMCWIDLLLLAEWNPKTLTIRGIKVVVERGQIAISVRELSNRWSLSTPTVQKILKEFVADERITVERSNVVNIITVLNYERYQSNSEQPQQQDLFSQQVLNVQPPKSKPQSKPKKTKHKYAPEVLLTEEEYGKLVAEHGEDGAKWMIQKLDDYKASRGTTYKSDYRAILNWVVGEFKKQIQYGKSTNIRQSVSENAKRQRDADFANYIAVKLSSGSVQGEIQDE